MPAVDNQTIELVFIAIVAATLILQTVFVIALLLTIRKSASAFLEEIETMRSSVMPIIYNTREVIGRLAPKIEEAADELTALTRSLRSQTADVQLAATEVIGRAQRIAGRLDSMASTVLDSVERAAEFMSDTVARPIRQVSGVLASVRAIVESLRTVDYSHRPQHGVHESSDLRSSEPQSTEKDMFV